MVPFFFSIFYKMKFGVFLKFCSLALLRVEGLIKAANHSMMLSVIACVAGGVGGCFHTCD